MADPRTTGYLSLFKYPPEDPLREGGKWAMAIGTVRSGDNLDMRKYQDHPGMPNELGHASDQSHGAHLSGPIGRSFYTRQRFTGDVEVWGIPYGGQLGAALETWRLFIWSNPIWNPTGYLVYVGGGLSKDTVIRRYDGLDDYTSIASSPAGYASAMMLRINGDDVEAWRVDNGDDPDNPANWYMACSVTDTTYRGPYYVGMAIEDPSAGGLSFTAIGGGKPIKTQIYRYVKPPIDKGRTT